MKKASKILLILLLVIIFFAAFAVIGFNSILKNATKEAMQLENITIDIADVNDGEYEGHSEIGVVNVDVVVTVQNGTITNIEILKHENGLGQPANVIVDDMIRNNTYDVDGITGATISSEVIINAVNDALRKGL